MEFNFDNVKTKVVDFYKIVKEFTLNSLNVNEPSEFILKVNKMIVKFSLSIVIVLFILTFIDFVFESKMFYALLLLIASPIIFILIKYILFLWLILIDLINSATKFYKSKTNDKE